MYVSPCCLGTVDGIAKKNMPGKLFFYHLPVPLHCVSVLYTQVRRNILLIGRTVLGFLLVFEWVDT